VGIIHQFYDHDEGCEGEETLVDRKLTEQTVQ
jgi:hypothetical protein